MSMSEEWPNGPLFEPTEKYRRDVEALLAKMFETKPSEEDERLPLPEDVRYRTWNTDGVLFLAICSNTGIPELDDHMILRRQEQPIDGFIRIRKYQYSRSKGTIDVIDGVRTEDEMESTRFPLEDDTNRKAVEEGIELGFYAASTSNYHEFLDDLAGYQYSLWG